MEIYPKVHRNWPSEPVPCGWYGGQEFLEGRGYVQVPLGVVQVSGPGRLKWLELVTTQSVTGLRAGDSSEALILDVKGHIELAFYLVEDEEKTWILTEEPVATRDFLEAMRFRSRVEIADVSDKFVVFGGILFHELGKDSLFSDSANRLGAVEWLDPWPQTVGETTTFTPPGDPHIDLEEALGVDCGGERVPLRVLEILPASAAGEFRRVLENFDFEETKLETWEALRIAMWRPRLGREGMPGVLPHELDWLRTAVSLNKGCYTGQETVAKLVNRGRPPRRLVFLDFDGSSEEMPEIGSEIAVESSREKAGVLTSVAFHPLLGQIGLALVPRTVGTDEILLVEGSDGVVVRAAQTVIVDPSGENPKRFGGGNPGGALGLRGRGGAGGARGAGGVGGAGGTSNKKAGVTGGLGSGGTSGSIKVGLKGGAQ